MRIRITLSRESVTSPPLNRYRLLVRAPHLAKRPADLPERRPRLGELDGLRQQVDIFLSRLLLELLQKALHALRVALRTRGLQPAHLQLRALIVVRMDLHLRAGARLIDVAIDAHGDLLTAIDLLEGLVGGIGQLSLKPTVLHQLDRTAELVPLL